MPTALDSTTIDAETKARFVAERIGPHRAVTPEGYLVCLGVPIARTGEQQYKSSELGFKGPERIVSVSRPADEVFSPKTIVSFEGKTVTSPHPPAFLNPDNEPQYHRGHLQNVRKGPRLPDGNQALIADLVIKSRDLINLVESGLRDQLSAGYDYVLEEDPKNPDNYFMSNIVANHVAVVPSGRAGEYVRILDEATVSPVTKEGTPPMAEEMTDKSMGVVASAMAFVKSLGWRPPEAETSKAADADPGGSVENNEHYNKEALERAERRNKDSMAKKGKDDGELEQEEKGAAPPEKSAEKGADKKSKDDDKDEVVGHEEKEENAKGMDAATAKRLIKSVDALAAALAKKAKDEDDDEEEEEKKEADDDDEEEEEKEKKEADDADLIPVATLPEKERPKNPIPGADAAKALDFARTLKEVVASSRKRSAIDAFNKLVSTLKGHVREASDDATQDSPYAALAERGDKAKEAGTRDATLVRTGTDAATADPGDAFVKRTKQFLGKNPGEVVQISEGGK